MVVIISWLWGAGCTQETQNQWSRAVQNWTGTDGVLEIYAGEVLVEGSFTSISSVRLNPLKGLLFRDPIVMAMVFWMLI